MWEINIVEKLVIKLQELKKTVSIMESCTGGGMANQITNICGASRVFSFCAVTYSNEYKVKMGVNPEIINKYSVYSIETAREMSMTISKFTNSNYGIGVTGKLNCADIGNQEGRDDIVYTSIYNMDKNIFIDNCIKTEYPNRAENKNIVIYSTLQKLFDVL